MSTDTTIGLASEQYPAILREIHDPPALLYVRGVIQPATLCLGVVGTRLPTRYGIEATEKLIRDIARAAPAITIVSGLATGIDAVAHRAALAAGLATIGVIGSGIDRHSFFPSQNIALAEKMVAAGGAVISEYPDGTPARKHHFPARNRIVAGLSRGVVIIEAKERSGALITARLALEENREVFALPGSIFSPHSAGPNMLIQKGAKLVLSSNDILEELGITTEETGTRAVSLSDIERRVIDVISREPQTIDELKHATDISTEDILSAVSMLELKGVIKNFGNGAWGQV
ncbi:MAG: DNA protecting protein DprA [Candidatus Sungbacteria bacterium RIFCSPLOWO2_02_FULL_51_17]|nr:MAG: DNA protecting protein DprA [Candidatus Sungbacteria bacterium RIFCSPHIGHO2_01_FULL_51_22]OHA11215.1 MAG: DNA protecting protein DprA [Candidatus Sungbacteria bacterium RIFCSPLOWO2_02_FULL_51_17]